MLFQVDIISFDVKLRVIYNKSVLQTFCHHYDFFKFLRLWEKSHIDSQTAFDGFYKAFAAYDGKKQLVVLVYRYGVAAFHVGRAYKTFCPGISYGNALKRFVTALADYASPHVDCTAFCRKGHI